MAELSIPARSDISHEHTWNAESVFPTVQAWEKEYKDIEAYLPGLEEGKEKLHNGARQLLEVLQSIEEVQRRTMVLFVYASMSHSVNMEDQAAAALYDRMQILAGKAAGATAFLEPELLTLGKEKFDEWKEEEYGLKTYSHYFDNLFRKARHVRSSEVEEIMGMLASPFSSPNMIFGSLTEADF
jgi:oligoendopeptidase F